MKITLINPNSTQAMNEAILSAAQRVARSEDTLRCLCVTQSPALINSDKEELEAAYWTMKTAEGLAESSDGFVIACHSDPGVNAIVQATGRPAIGLGYASLFAASLYPGKSAILVISEASIPRKLNLQKRYGFEGRFDSFATGYSESMSSEEVLDRLLSTARRALGSAAYRTVVLGCAGMSVVTEELRRELDVPIVDGTEEAVKQLFGMVSKSSGVL